MTDKDKARTARDAVGVLLDMGKDVAGAIAPKIVTPDHKATIKDNLDKLSRLTERELAELAGKLTAV